MGHSKRKFTAFPGQVALYVHYQVFKTISRLAKQNGCSMGEYIGRLISHEVLKDAKVDEDGNIIEPE